MTIFTGTNANNTLPPVGADNTGDDIFKPLLGIDTVDGGNGDDILEVDYSTNAFAGGGGYSGGIVSGINDNASGSFSGYFYAYRNATGGYDQVNFSNIERFQITGTNQGDNIRGGWKDDTLNGGGGNDNFYAVEGIDQIDGGMGIDTIEYVNWSGVTSNLAIDGIGTAIFLADGTSVKNVEQFKNLWTGYGNDSITFSSRYDETIKTGIGNDVINAGLGKDNVDGQGGFDALTINYSTNTYAGGTNYGAGVNSDYNSNGAGGWNGYVYAYYADDGNSYDQVYFYNIEKLNLAGTSKGDYFKYGGYGSISIDGGAGVDTIGYADFSAEVKNLTVNSTGTAITQANGTVVKNVEQFNNLWTGSGNDTISLTGRNNQVVSTGAGNDIINLGLGKDTVNGEGGSDTLTISYATNTYAGGATYGAGINGDYNSNGAGGWNGNVYAYYADDSNSYDQVNFSNVEKLNLTGTGKADYFKYGGYSSINIDGGAGVDTIGNADFSTQTTALTIDNTGVTITQVNGTVVKNVEQFGNLWTGSGSDKITFTDVGNKAIYTGLGSDTVSTGGGNDTIYGQDGDDTINAGLGKNYVEGGAGSDTLTIDYSSNTYAGGTNYGAGVNSNTYTYDANGWDGYVTVYYADDYYSYDQTDFRDIEKLNIIGTGAGDYFNHGGYSSINIDGGAGVDTIVNADFSAETTALTIDNTGTAITQVNGTVVKNVEQFNNLWTGSGSDKITFTDVGNKTIYTGLGSDTVSTGGGNDTIYGQDGNDIINAGLGKNYIEGGAGSDTLTIDYSSNTYAGGTNYGAGVYSNTYTYDANGWDGYVRVYYADEGNSYDQADFRDIEKLNIIGTGTGDYFNHGGYGSINIDGGAGVDTIGYADFSVEVKNLTVNSTGTAITQANGTVVKNVERFNYLYTGSGSDKITFSGNFDDRIYTGDGSDTITSAGGNDYIEAGAGDDSINAGLGRETVYGGAGNDLLTIDYSANTWAGDTNYGAGLTGDCYNVSDGGVSGYIRAYTDASGNYDQVNFANIERFKVVGTKFNDFIDLWYSATQVDINGGLGTDTIDEADFSNFTTDVSINNGSTAQTFSNGSKITSIEQFNNLWTGSGNDTIAFSGNFDNRIYTGDGSDTITSAGGNDYIEAGAGDDSINAGLGRETVYGGTGNDLLTIDYSANTWAGDTNYGAGLTGDSYNVSDGGVSGYIRAYTDASGNYNQVDFANIERFKVVGTKFNDFIDLWYSATQVDINGGLGTDTLDEADFSSATNALTISNSGAAITQSNGTVVKNVELFNYLTTGSGNDTINFSLRYKENINTGAGDDTINSGLGGVDTVDGGTGNDLLIVNYSSNTYAGGTSYGAGIVSSISGASSSGWNGYFYAYYADNGGSYDQVNFSNIDRFRITGTTKNDDIRTGSGNDTINSGAGNDTIRGGGGIDNVNGSTGTDVLADTDFTDVTVNLTINNGTATQTLSNGYKITNIEQFTNLTTGAGNDTLTFSGRYNDTVNTYLGNDTINLGLGQDTVEGGLGNDLLIIDYSSNAYAGSDTYGAGIQGNSFNYQGSGSWSGSLFAYTDKVGNRDSISFSGIERFQITGTGKNDLIYGGSGNDTLTGGVGTDTLIGGGGNDVYVNPTGDTIVENVNEGIDTIQSSATFSLTTLPNIENLTLTGTAVINGTGNAANNVLTGNSAANNLNGGTGNDTIAGGAGSDTLIGGAGTDTVDYYNATASVKVDLITGLATDGQGGTDTISQFENIKGSNTAGDSLTGSTGVNTIYGYGGADTLTGGLGNDTLYLGSDTAKDTVIYNYNDGADTVFEFVRGTGGDRLSFSGITDIDVLVSGANTQFRLGDGTAGNNGFGTGLLLLTTNGTTGFVASDIGVNLVNTAKPTGFLFS